MVDYIPIEKGQTVRQPSTANLMVDSDDRNINSYPYWTNFSIQKPTAILNGYFTRIGVTETVLQWGEPTIAPDTEGYMDISSNGVITRGVLLELNQLGIPTWATAEQLCQDVSNGVFTPALSTVADLSGASFHFSNPRPGTVAMDLSGNTTGQSIQWRPRTRLNLPEKMNLWKKFYLTAPNTWASDNVGWRTIDVFYFIDPRFTRYIDIVSPDLTYAQDVKDSSTQQKDKNVLVRWYLDWDDSQSGLLDGFGFPILQGCRPFSQRRLYNPPKQIRWEPNLPIGNLSFEVYGDDGNPLESTAEFLAAIQNPSVFGQAISSSEFLLTLQVSEV
jgi:hypothetical protein